MSLPSTRPAHRGFLLIPTLVALAVVGTVLGAYYAVLQTQLSLVIRATARAQALYLAEAGLDAASDLLSQDWTAWQDPLQFPRQEQLSALINGVETTVGTCEVTVGAVGPSSLRVTSVGRSVPVGVERRLMMQLVRRERPLFVRRGAPGQLALQAVHFDQDGLPDLLDFSGALDPLDTSSPLTGVLSGGSPDAKASGFHLLASFSDVDGDGDLDLLLSDVPSRQGGIASSFIPTVTAAEADEQLVGTSTTTADVFHTGFAIPIVAKRWLFAPEGTLSELNPDVDVFINQIISDGTQVVWWGESPSTS